MQSRPPEVQSAGLVAARLLFKTVWVFVAASVPLVLLEGGFGILIAFGVIYYFIHARDKAETPDAVAEEAAEVSDEEFDEKSAKFRFRRGTATILAFLAIGPLPVLAWIAWAFPGLADSADPNGLDWLTVPIALTALAGMLLATALCGWWAAASLRQTGESVAQGCRRALSGRGWAAIRPAVSNFAKVLGVLGVLALLFSVSSFTRLFGTITEHGRFPDLIEAVIAMPAVPMWLYASIVLLALSRRLDHEDRTEGMRPDAPHARHRSSPILYSVSVAVSAAALLVAVGNVLHLGILGAFGPVSAAGPIATVSVKLEDWVDEQIDSGRTASEIAAQLRDFGHWAPTSPDHGLVELVPSLKSGKSFERIDSTVCRFSIDAGIADVDEVSGIDWLQEDDAARPVKYCVAIHCPSPGRPPDDITMSLTSSHPSRNRYWIETIHFDIFARGIAESGGYCTRSGMLADRFQG